MHRLFSVILLSLFLLPGFGHARKTQKNPVPYHSSVRGSLTKAEIRKVIFRYRKQIQYCFNQALTRNPAAFGRILYEWFINAQGKVTRVRVLRRDYPDILAVRCIKRRILRWRFPKPRGGGIVIVRFPFQVNRPGTKPGTKLLVKLPRRRGFMSKPNIRRVVRAYRSQLGACYMKELKISPKLRGKLVVEWTVTPKGNTTSVRILSDTLKSPRVGQCVTKSIRGWVFPKPVGGGYVKIRYPFLFRYH